jgi:hypothetical protein
MSHEPLRELERAELLASAKIGLRLAATVAFLVSLSRLVMYVVVNLEAQKPPYLVGVMILGVTLPFTAIAMLSSLGLTFIESWIMRPAETAPVRVGLAMFATVALTGLWISRRTAAVVFKHVSSSASAGAVAAAHIELVASKERHYTDGFDAGIRTREDADAARAETSTRLTWKWLFAAAVCGVATAGLAKWCFFA